MIFDSSLYDLTQECAAAIGQAIRVERTRDDEAAPTPPLLLQVHGGLAESPGWFLLQASEFDPEPITAQMLQVRDTYASLRLIQAILELMASEQWLERSHEGTYTLTETGWNIIHRMRTRQETFLARLKLLPMDEITQLEQWMHRILQASLQSDTPPGTWCLAHSHHRAPETHASPLTKILHYTTDFNAFRDDAHMASWQHYEIDGATWEAFSLICNESANQSHQIATQLSHRGYAPYEYQNRLEYLERCGWLDHIANEDLWNVTSLGQQIRKKAEQITDKHFFLPWSCLSEEEMSALEFLLTRLRDHANNWQ